MDRSVAFQKYAAVQIERADAPGAGGKGDAAVGLAGELCGSSGLRAEVQSSTAGKFPNEDAVSG